MRRVLTLGIWALAICGVFALFRARPDLLSNLQNLSPATALNPPKCEVRLVTNQRVFNGFVTNHDLKITSLDDRELTVERILINGRVKYPGCDYQVFTPGNSDCDGCKSGDIDPRNNEAAFYPLHLGDSLSVPLGAGPETCGDIVVKALIRTDLGEQEFELTNELADWAF